MALPQPKFDDYRSFSHSKRERIERTQTAAVVPLPRTASLQKPVWLKGLETVRVASTALVAIAAVSTLGLYTNTVKTQNTFRQEHRHLQQLRRDRSAFQLIDESMANAMRDSAVVADMVPRTPERILELDALPARTPPTLMDGHSTPSAIVFPTGY